MKAFLRSNHSGGRLWRKQFNILIFCRRLPDAWLQRNGRRAICLVAAVLMLNRVSWAQTAEPTGKTNEIKEAVNKLKLLSLDQLLNEQVTIVSKTPEKLSQSPSAVQVITGEDIHRSGATTLPEALRLAPNLEVAQVNSHDWAISARGFNNTLANKLLVMIDGRTIYTPLDAGVFWDVQNVLLEDIDRIEVVSGPGGALWGANAVNGVINIVSKSAKDTQGTYASAGAGSFLEDYAAFRYGASISSNLFFRVYGQRLDHESAISHGNDATNEWDMTQGGFRMDGYVSDVNQLTLQGDFYGGTEQAQPKDTKVDGQNVLGRWTHTFSEESDLSVQMYFDRTWRDDPGVFAEDLKTYDFDFQYRLPLGERQSFIWGAGYRLMADHVLNTPALAFLPPNRNLQLFSSFVQDEITLIPDRLKWTVGTKVEHNDFSGFEVEPSTRLTWTPNDRHTVWGAISRAVRSPSRIDRDFFIPASPLSPALTGGPNFISEELLAYELGYRVRPVDRFSLSVAGFFNQYDNIRSVEMVGPSLQILNGLRAQSYGVELSGTFQATDWWRLRGGYNYLHENVWQKSGHVDVNQTHAEGNDPANQVSLQSIMNLPGNVEFDATARYVDALPNPHVPGYITCDLRVAWRLNNNLEFSIVGQNLAGPHVEFGAVGIAQQIPRSIFGKVTWRF